MRPICKGEPPRDDAGRPIRFDHYQEARKYLVKRLGPFCSYCEVKLPVGLAVEHVQPQSAHPEKALEWENFLLACPSCNAHKADKDINEHTLNEYLWPDRNNTFLALRYAEGGKASVNPELSEADQQRAQKLIHLVGLDNMPTDEIRTIGKWNDRRKEWDKAQEVRQLLLQNDTEAARALVTQMIEGYFSIWMSVFDDCPEMRKEILRHFEPYGTAMDCFDAEGNARPRPGQSI